MLTYQAYLANANGDLRSPEVFLADDDMAAIEKAQCLCGCVELWQDRRRVKRWEYRANGPELLEAAKALAQAERDGG